MSWSGTASDGRKGRKGKIAGLSCFGSGFTTTSLLSRLIEENVDKANKENSIKVAMFHSEEDSELATKVVETLNIDSRFRATADCQLSVFKMMSFVSYLNAAIEWADVVAVLITNRYLDQVTNLRASIWSPNGNLHARHGFKLLQHKHFYDNKFPIVAAVEEGTIHNCHQFIEFKLCVHLDSAFSALGDAISHLYCGYCIGT